MNETQSQTQPQQGMFKDGGKLDAFVSKYKKGGKARSYGKKKCKCGCDMIEVKENGGTIERCACGCEVKKQQQGGTVPQNRIPFQRANMAGRL